MILEARTWVGVFALLLGMLIGASQASAGHHCKADARKLCPGTSKGAARAQCLEKHKSELSPKCGEQVAALGRAREACRNDVATLCGGDERARRCLRRNGDKLSPACREALGALRKRR